MRHGRRGKGNESQWLQSLKESFVYEDGNMYDGWIYWVLEVVDWL